MKKIFLALIIFFTAHSAFANWDSSTNMQTLSVSTAFTQVQNSLKSIDGTSGTQPAKIAVGATGVEFEGATANGFETILSVLDPTSDITISLPLTAGNVFISTLTSNDVDVANSLWAVSNGLRFEGATANDFETTITLTDPTADRTLTLPDGTFTFSGAAAAITDNRLVRGDGGVAGLQESTISVTDAGEMTNTSQPSFSTTNSGAQNDFTNNVSTTVILDTEVFDQGADFATNTFTAPVTGRYQLNVQIDLTNIDNAMTEIRIDLVTSNRSYILSIDPRQFVADLVGKYPFGFSVLADMDANDTAIIQVVPGSGANQIDIVTGDAFFSGFLAQ